MVQSRAARAAGQAAGGQRQPLLGEVGDQVGEALRPRSRAGCPTGMRQSVKNSSAVSWAWRPSLSRLRPRSNPGAPRSTTTRLMPRWVERRVGLDRHHHQVGVDPVGDERLGPVEDVLVAVPDGGGGDGGQVGAGPGLGHGDGQDLLAPGDARQPPAALLRRWRSAGSRGGRCRCGGRTRGRRRSCPTRWTSSATIRLNRKSSLPPPPYSVGMAMPRKPCAPACSKTDRSTIPASSHWPDRGTISASTKRRKLDAELVVLVVEQAAVAWIPLGSGAATDGRRGPGPPGAGRARSLCRCPVEHYALRGARERVRTGRDRTRGNVTRWDPVPGGCTCPTGGCNAAPSAPPRRSLRTGQPRRSPPTTRTPRPWGWRRPAGRSPPWPARPPRTSSSPRRHRPTWTRPTPPPSTPPSTCPGGRGAYDMLGSVRSAVGALRSRPGRGRRPTGRGRARPTCGPGWRAAPRSATAATAPSPSSSGAADGAEVAAEWVAHAAHDRRVPRPVAHARRARLQGVGGAVRPGGLRPAGPGRPAAEAWKRAGVVATDVDHVVVAGLHARAVQAPSGARSASDPRRWWPTGRPTLGQPGGGPGRAALADAARAGRARGADRPGGGGRRRRRRALAHHRRPARPSGRPGRPPDWPTVAELAGVGRRRRALRPVPHLAGRAASGSPPGAPTPSAPAPRPPGAPPRGRAASRPATAGPAASATCRRPGCACAAAPSTRWTGCAWPTSAAGWPPSPSTAWPSRLSPPVVGAVVDFDGGGRYRCEMTDVDPDAVAHRHPGGDDLPAAQHGRGRPQLLLEGAAGRHRRRARRRRGRDRS